MVQNLCSTCSLMTKYSQAKSHCSLTTFTMFIMRSSRARCSSVVRMFAHDAMGRQIDPSWWTHWAISRSSQCSTTGNKGCGMCYPVYGMMHIKEPLLLIGRSSPCDGSGFPLLLSELSFTIYVMPYNRK